MITTKVGGLAEAVEDGRTGLVVPPEDAPALAEAIDCYFDHNLEDKFSENIVAGNGRFAWQELISKIEALTNMSTAELILP